MVAAAGPAAIAGEDNDDGMQTIEMENGEALYLSFGADLGDMSLEEYVEEHADESGTSNSEVIQYQDVDQVNINEQGQAVSISIDGGEATAIQEVNQENNNSQIGQAAAENFAGHETMFEDVGDVYLIMGDGDKQFDGWGIVDDNGEATVTQTAEASVSQAQEVSQANVIQNTTALAYAEDESTATAVQVTEQSNLNLQEGSANATNVYGDNYDGDKHKKGDDGDAATAAQAASATVEQAQEVQQINVHERNAAVAIAVGDNASATAVQISEQSNINEQIGTAEAINVLMESAGMHVATASTDGTTDVVSQDSADYPEPKDKKGDHADDGVTQAAEASVTQYQSVEQVNFNLNSSAQAIATGGSEAEAVQLTYQQNINAQVASAEALNVFLEDADGDHDKKDKKGDGDYEEGHDYEGVFTTETTTATINGDGVGDTNMTAFDYDGSNDQLNDVDQYSNAEIEQSQNVTQVNLVNSNTALAVAEDEGSASAFQISMQENENVQIANAEATSVHEEPVDDEDEKDQDDEDEKDHDEEQTNDDEESDTVEETKSESESDDDTKKDDSMPGFGAAVALVAMLAAAMLARRT
ncbi:PGF-CTERM sorting domain-containing protein [Halosolutus halophilus]|uniref:PGF-CTERM sorting domain-containing protein n=1 Tax=Halosolutus halophilus TaxID=1552990 RepID=UPI0022351BD9|nr:PGF-CTERM sorting domain-containing protein [Halosolutus halophilus]